MARLWSGGAEIQSVTSLMEFTAIVTTAPVLETTIKRSGAAAWRISNTSAIEGFRHQFTAGQGLYYFRFYLYVVAFPSASFFIGGARTSGAAKITVRLTSAGLLQFWNTEDNTQIGTDSSAISTATWYRIEMSLDDTTLATTSCEARAYVDTPGNVTTFWNPSGTADLSVAITSFGCNTPGGDATLDYVVDDLAINDSTGSFQNSWCGEGEVIALFPNAAGDNNAWARGGADSGANWSQVDEFPPNDATDYVESNTSGQIDDYNLDATPAAMASDDVINCVQVGFRNAVSDATGGDPDVVLRIKASASGTVEESASLDINSVTWSSPNATSANPLGNYQLTLYDLPGASTTAWTKADLDTSQIGIREAVTDTHFVRVSAIWLMVDHKPGAAATKAPPPFQKHTTYIWRK